MVDARELHAFLEVKTKYSDWIQHLFSQH
ncbi:antA/AntB antirepressor family protein [Clostridium estertheticum]|nr:antA/AntB antirepressor family protein [Clostridium estertheticum]WAG43573.1 antA/AntB antirepressor family protein [Clostridium estertheticum]